MIYFIIFILWSIYRYFFRLPEFVDELIVKPILWLPPIFFLGEKVNFTDKKRLQNFFIGLLLGVLLGGGMLIFRGIKPNSLTSFNLSQIFLMTIISLATGFTEEIVFRGYLLTKFAEKFKDKIFANIISSLLFILIHIPVILFVYKYSLSDMLAYLALLFGISLVYGAIFIKTKSLTASILTHAIWNLSDYF